MNNRLRNLFLLCLLTPTVAFAMDASKHPAYPPYHINLSAKNFLQPTGLSPNQIYTAYGFNNFPTRGEGQIIGIIDAFDDPTIEDDLNTFSSTFNLPACTTDNGCFQKIYARGSQPAMDPSWSLEIALDVEWAHAIAPRAKILLVEAADNSLDELAQAARIAVKNGANVISMSWGTPEFFDETTYDTVFNRRHILFVAASGDAGFGTIYPAASPYVLSVGGTSLFMDQNDNYLDEIAWSGSGGGLSMFERQLDNQRRLPVPHNITDTRAIPDVSYHADPNQGYSVYSSVPFNGNSGWFVVGGTSAAAPQWAALVALMNDVVGEGLTINTVLYRIGGDAAYLSNFHDVICGNNGTCGFFCNAQAGYDYVTGLGSPRLPTLVSTVNTYYLSRAPLA